jgi:hydroxylamine reductase
MQDLLVHQVKGISQYAARARALGAEYSDAAVDHAVLKFLFSTLTNVNFDSARFVTYCKEAQAICDQAKALYEKACAEKGETPEDLSANLYPLNLTDFSVGGLESEGRKVFCQFGLIKG